MSKNRAFVLCLSTALSVVAVGCADDSSGGGSGALTTELRYEPGATNVNVVVSRELGGAEVLHARLRSLAEGDSLDCATMSAAISKLDATPDGLTYTGPQVDDSMFVDSTTPETLLDQTQADYDARLAKTYFVDVCIMADGKPVHQARYDLRQAKDRRGGGVDGKADDFDDGVKIASNQLYAEACIGDMGDIPFWGPRISADGEPPDYNTVSCMEIGTPIPSTIDGVPQTEHKTRLCDNPQYIYSHCEADATSGEHNGPRVAHARNDKGTHWVLLCRKSHNAMGRFEDMAMIGHNPFTGQTCFFQNQLPFGEDPKPSNDGTKIPHPADNVSSEASPQQWGDLWGGIQGGIGPSGGIQCQGCHSTDPFIHTPWIDGAKNPDGTSVIPKMGENPDFVEGYKSPYRILDAEDQGWTSPKHLVSEEAAPCTKCHRIGLDQWTANSSVTSRNNPDGGCVFCGQAPWVDRLEAKQTSWHNLITDSHKKFENTFWMPPNAKDVLNEELWPESDFAKAISFIRKCGVNPATEGCVWESLPEEPGDPAVLPEVEETGVPLAEEALGILGAKYLKGGVEVEGNRRCAECHATSKVGFRDWLKATEEAVEAGIDLAKDPAGFTQEEALAVVNYMRKAGEGSVFAAAKIGVYAPGVQFSWFQRLFQKAYDAGWGIPYGAFLQRVSMPKGAHLPMSGREFSVVRKWFLDEKLANLDQLLVEVPPPATCDEVRAEYNVNAASPWLVDTHINGDFGMQYEGWHAKNLESGIQMHGCEKDDPLTCFETHENKFKLLPEGKEDGQRIIEVLDLGFDTSFWMRTSADGRWIGNGGKGSDVDGFRATITDATSGLDIGVKGSYDPGFFPNNDGFIMQGGGAGLCGQSVLSDPALTADGIDFTEPGCSKAQGINLYQHVAVDLDGGDYFVINSQFTSDSGSGNKDPRAPFSETSTMKFSPLVFTGTEWTQKEAVIVKSPYEGDSVLSPSGRLVTSRFAGPDGVALGYMIRRVDATPNAAGSYDINIDHAAQFICGPGAKANISFDERWSVTHVYEDDTANLYVDDLVTGVRTKVTNMPKGRKALFPHFRSDGWIYFLVTGKEQVVGDTEDEPLPADGSAPGDAAMATDAALRLAAAAQ